MAESENSRMMNEVAGQMVKVVAEDFPKENNIARNVLNKETKLAQCLELKVGAIVMLKYNVDVARGWANGVLCKVVSIDDLNVQLYHLGNEQSRYI